MKPAENLKRIAFDEIDRQRGRIADLGYAIWAEPEEGFREFKTAEKVCDFFRESGISFESGLAITGVEGRLNGSGSGPRVAVIGELDAVINPDHPDADEKSGAVHACGHHAQIAALAGAACGLKKVIDLLDGSAVFMAVPAEEMISLNFRKRLIDEGKISYYGGKQELIRLGVFDDIDIAVCQHAYPDASKPRAFFETMNALVCKAVRFSGKASHAGAAPEKGINAMQAYHVALSAMNAQRETYRDEDAVRVHGIATKGGDSVNVVPGEVLVEMQVRARTLEALGDANGKVDRALRAGGLGIGAHVEIGTTPGYLPLVNNAALQSLWAENAEAVLGKDSVSVRGHTGGCTDMGDLSQVLPCVHPFLCGGFSGRLHGSDFKLHDENAAFLIPAKIAAALVIDLLSDGAVGAKRVLADFEPGLTKRQYLELLDSYFSFSRWEPV